MPSSADKRTDISCACLRAYAERKGASAAKALLSPQGTLRDSIAGFLKYAVESATEKGSARGCLVVCVAPLVNDAEVQQFLQKRGRGRRGAGGSAVSGTGLAREKSRLTFPLPCAQSKSRILLAWPDHACADRHAAQDASQGCRGSGRPGASAAPEGHRQAEVITFSRRRLSRANAVPP